MGKPATLPAWATNGGALLSTPSAGKIQVGFAGGERGAAQYFNFLIYWICQWLSWLNAGILDGNYEITGTLKVDGTTELVGALTLDAAVATDVTLAANKRLKLSGTGDVAHGDYVRYFSLASGSVPYSTGNFEYVASAGSQTAHFAISLQAGDRYRGGGILVTLNWTAGTIALKLWEIDDASGINTQIGSTTNVTSGGFQQHNILSSDYTLVAGKHYLVECISAANGDAFMGVQVTWDRP